VVISEKGKISNGDKKVQNCLAICVVYNSWLVEYLYLGHLPQTCNQEVLIAPTRVGSGILLQHIPQVLIFNLDVSEGREWTLTVYNALVICGFNQRITSTILM
jgi:hypothetical protein